MTEIFHSMRFIKIEIIILIDFKGIKILIYCIIN